MATVTDLITSARDYTDDLAEEAKKAITETVDFAKGLGYIVPNITPLKLPPLPNAPGVLTPPVLGGYTFDVGQFPSEAPPDYQDISAFEAGQIPVFTANAPTIKLPSAPSQLAAFTTPTPTINTSITFPDPPDSLRNPTFTAPTIVDRVAPSKPNVVLPVFDAQRPTGIPDAPENLEQRFATSYRDAAPATIALLNSYVDAQMTKINPRFNEQMARIETQLQKYLDGGTGLSPAVENAIYERAKGKNSADSLRVRDATYAEAAGRGFTMPPGFAMSAIQQARQAGADNNARAAAEIVVMQAEMEQRNLQFAVTTSAALRGTVMNAVLSYMQNLISINGQALDYAKSNLSAIIETYNTAVKVYSLQLEAYKVDASVFEVRLKSALAGIELYQVEIKALEALTNVDRAKVDVYKARIDALTGLAAVYRVQIEAAQGKANLEKLKIDLFQSQVQGYSALVQAKNAEWQGYRAGVDGEQAKAQLFAIEAQAYSAQVAGFRAATEAQAETVKAAGATNEARARQFAAQVSAYSAVVQAGGEVARTQLENQRQEIVAFQAQTAAATANAQVQLERYRAVSMVDIENAKFKLSTQLAEANDKRSFNDLLARLGTASATISANLAGAALSGMNTLAAQTVQQ